MIRIVTIIITAGIIVAIVAGLFYILPTRHMSLFPDSTIVTGAVATTSSTTTSTTTARFASTIVPVFVVTHIAPPQSIKGIYFTSWAVGTPSFRKSLFNILDGTIINTVVIDVKDYSGRIAFEVNDPDLIKMGSVQKRILDIKEFIGSLHDRGVYVIARVAVFQDPFLVRVKPEWAVTDLKTGKLWRDSGGAYWADPTNKEVWKYNTAIAKQAYEVGFDEINFDYIRFPSDGSVSSARYSSLPAGSFVSSSASTTSTSTKVFISGKSKIMKEFFSYLHDQLSLGENMIPISADLFGQVTSDPGDMGIGQKLENAMPYFDFIDPMVYPSHYINGFLGYAKPATRPYEIVKYAMDQAVTRSAAASSSPLLMRPWLQAFDLGAIYTPEMVRTQIRATYDAGLTSWILWNAGSVYNKSALLTDPKPTDVATKISTASSTLTF